MTSWLEDAVDFYRAVNLPLVLLLCVCGSLGHVFAISTLHSQPSPTNLLLLSMSCSQLTLCANFLYSTLFKFASDEHCVSFLWSYAWVQSLRLSASISVLAHMAAVFHTVALSLVRFFALRSIQALEKQQWFTYEKCRLSLVLIYGGVVLVGVPLSFTSEIVEVPDKEDCVARDASFAGHPAFELSLSANPFVHMVNFWLFSAICKLIPSAILSLMTALILDQLKTIRRISSRFSNDERERQHERTTKIILVSSGLVLKSEMVMLSFILVELPQGVLAVLGTVFETLNLMNVLGDFFDLVTLLTSCLIFALLCYMNSRIRHAFTDCAFHLPLRHSRLASSSSLQARRLRQSMAEHRLLERTATGEKEKPVAV